MANDQLPELPWIKTARSYLGVSEIPGSRHSTVIQGWLSKLGAWWRDDETPWCGVFVATCLGSGYMLPKNWMRALEWLNVGRPLSVPCYGCLVVFARSGGGHVGFVVGQDRHGNLMVLGGNQGNRVSIAAFPRSRVVAYRWPGINPLPGRYDLPVLDGKLSQSEA